MAIYNLPLVHTCSWTGIKSYNSWAFDIWIRMWNIIGSPMNSKAIALINGDTVEVLDTAITPEFSQFDKWKK
jgi:hypothetical protein